MKIAAISSTELPDAAEGTIKNNYLYNDKELFDDGCLDWYDYGYRNYDPQIGRFPQLDPLTDKFPELTPFQYASCDPITNIDMDGLEGLSSIGAATNTAAGFVNTASTFTHVFSTITSFVSTTVNTLENVAVLTSTMVTVQLKVQISDATRIIKNTPKTLKNAAIHIGKDMLENPIEYLEGGEIDEAANVGKIATTEDELTQKILGDLEKEQKSINQLNREIQKGQAPKSIERFDKGQGTKNLPEDEVHFDDGSSLYRSGKWRHDTNHKFTNKEIKYLTKNGWKIPD